MAERLRHLTRPIALLVLLSVLSLAVRAAWLGQPCHAPCRSASDRVLIFDEDYYVNAARVIAGIRPPPGAQYVHAPLGRDPNSEHPQLGKLVIAGSIELFGDGPLAWRLGSLIAGSLSILGMFALVRSAGGTNRVALIAAALMACDNLLLVHGRIGTLDIYVLCAMLWAAVLYLRRRPAVSGMVLGVGATIKLVAPYLLLVLALFEGWRVWTRLSKPRDAAIRFACCTASAAVGFGALLALMDRIAPPYDATAKTQLSAGPFHHISHMLSYAAGQTSPHGPSGIASYPWGWLVDIKPIVYLNVNPARPAPGLTHVHPAVHFLGMISPPLLLLALPAAALATWRTLEARRSAFLTTPDVRLSALAVAWIAGTFLPFVLLSAIWKRTSYLYYMVIVMPGLYLSAALLVPRLWERRRRLLVVWGAALLLTAVGMYPLTPLP
ncbi:MAG: glycosyltransferase family 39 protein [Solirubrobacterales bacterium]|nr:glycosyltransferase family 39 protein [Solirubrobacterales bacterium]